MDYTDILEYCIENGIILNEGLLDKLKNKFHKKQSIEQSQPKRIVSTEERKKIYNKVMNIALSVKRSNKKYKKGFDISYEDKDDFINGNKDTFVIFRDSILEFSNILNSEVRCEYIDLEESLGSTLNSKVSEYGKISYDGGEKDGIIYFILK